MACGASRRNSRRHAPSAHPIPSRGFGACIQHNAGGMCAIGPRHSRKKPRGATAQRCGLSPRTFRTMLNARPQPLTRLRCRSAGGFVWPLRVQPPPALAIGYARAAAAARLALAGCAAVLPVRPRKRGLPKATATATAKSNSGFGAMLRENAPAVCLQSVAPCSARQGLRKSRDEAARPLTRLRLGAGRAGKQHSLGVLRNRKTRS